MRASQQVAQGRIEDIKESDERIKKGFKTAGNLASTVARGAGIAGGAALASKIAPFLSEYITPELALKGISKINPKFGEALKKGMKDGLSLESGLNFLKENITKKQSQEEEPIEQKQKFGGAIRRYSEELMNFIEDYIARGRDPHEAGFLAINQKKFQPIIKKMEKDYKAPFEKILESMFGTMQRPEQQQESQQPNQTELPLNQGQQPQHQQTPQQGGQGGQGQQALMAILQKIQQQRGG
jgi:hypothetical protein